MGTDGAGDKNKHNPDSDNLKSSLKKSGKRDKKNNRVVFNENKNEFFDADYIILIREECDFDEEDDDGNGVCTCYQHEMVRLQCCEPDCSCGGGGYEELQMENQTPQSPKFAPPMEFVDAVTLSPPEGYKDMELEEQAYKQMHRNRQQRTALAVCRECSANQEYEGDKEKGDSCQTNSDIIKPKIDLDDDNTEKIDQSQQTTPTSPNNSGENYGLGSSVDEEMTPEDLKPLPAADSPVTGILKGGKLWRQQSGEQLVKLTEQFTKTDSLSDEDSAPRTVRFIDGENKKPSPPSESERKVEGKEEDTPAPNQEQQQQQQQQQHQQPESVLTFKLGNHVLISNNSLKPNSAVRQLFPCTTNDDQQYLITSESLKAFDESKKPSFPQTDSIKKVIERNALRRSLLRYEPKSKKAVQKTDNSLVERIKQLTCDIDDVSVDSDDLSSRVSPTGEEGSNDDLSGKLKESRNFSPSSSSTASSNSSTSSTYKKITDLFGKIQTQPRAAQTQTLPDIANNQQIDKKEYYNAPEYTLSDIDEVLINEENKNCAPDVLAGTPASESGDELVVFVQQDANRTERIKKRYEEDDENDDYGFNHRPTVRGIKPRFGTTTEILQQIQNQIQLPSTNANLSWPYYSESGLKRDEINTKSTQYHRQTNQNCYQTKIECLPKNRPLSPPPQEISRTYHQTMVYIPYNHIESVPNNDYYRYQTSKKYVEPIYQSKMLQVEEHNHKVIKNPYSNYHMMPTRSESPLMGNYSMARSTQTSTIGCMSGCNFYQIPSTLRLRDSFRAPFKQSEYVNKTNRHSFPTIRTRYNPQEGADHVYMDENAIHYYNYVIPKESPVGSPTKAKYIERGVPEGAASVSPQDANSGAPPKPLFYAMNV